jgi:parvulin-like peptidyl-prolyl isomerase
MATKRKTKTGKISRRTASKVLTKSVTEAIDDFTPTNLRKPLPFGAKLVILVLIGVSVFWLVRKYRGSIIAAVVNKTPILRLELNQVLMEKYGKQELDQIVSERLLEQTAKREGVSVSPEDIQKERDALKERLGGDDNLKAALEQYGLSDTELTKTLKLKLVQQKLAEKLFKIEVKDDEVKTFFDDNKELYTGKKFDDVKADIKESLKQQKLQQEFSTWFDGERKKAQVQIFI